MHLQHRGLRNCKESTAADVTRRLLREGSFAGKAFTWGDTEAERIHRTEHTPQLCTLSSTISTQLLCRVSLRAAVFVLSLILQLLHFYISQGIGIISLSVQLSAGEILL